MKSRLDRISELLDYAFGLPNSINKYAEENDDRADIQSEDDSFGQQMATNVDQNTTSKNESDRDKLIALINKNPNILDMIIRQTPDLFFEDRLDEAFPDKINIAIDRLSTEMPAKFLNDFSDRPFVTKVMLERAAFRDPEAFLANKTLIAKYSDIAKDCAESLYSKGMVIEIIRLDALDHLDSSKQLLTISSYFSRFGKNPQFGMSDRYPKIDAIKYGHIIDQIADNIAYYVDDRDYGADVSKLLGYIGALSRHTISDVSKQRLLETVQIYLKDEQRLIWQVIADGFIKNFNKDIIDELIKSIKSLSSKEGINYDDIFYNFNNNIAEFFLTNRDKLTDVINDIVFYANPAHVLRYMLPLFPSIKSDLHNALLDTVKDSSHTLINEWQILEREFPDILKMVMEIYTPLRSSYINQNILDLMKKYPEYGKSLLKRLATKAPLDFLNAIEGIAEYIEIGEDEYRSITLDTIKGYSKASPVNFLNSGAVKNKLVTIDILKDCIVEYLSGHAADSRRLHEIYKNRKLGTPRVNDSIESVFNAVADQYPEVEELLIKRIQVLNPSVFLTLGLKEEYPTLYEEALEQMANTYPSAFISQMFDEVKDSHKHLARIAAGKLSSDSEFFRYRLDKYNPESARERILRFAQREPVSFLREDLIDNYPEAVSIAITSLIEMDISSYSVFFNNDLYLKFPQHLDKMAERILSLAQSGHYQKAINTIIADLSGDTDRNPVYNIDIKLFSQNPDRLERSLKVILTYHPELFLDKFLSKYPEFVKNNLGVIINNVGSIKFLKKAVIELPEYVDYAIISMAEHNPLSYLTFYKAPTSEDDHENSSENMIIEAVKRSDSRVDLAINSLNESKRDLFSFVSSSLTQDDGARVKIINLYPEYKDQVLNQFIEKYHDAFLLRHDEYSEFYTPELLNKAAVNNLSDINRFFAEEHEITRVPLNNGELVTKIDLLTSEQLKQLCDNFLSILSSESRYSLNTFFKIFRSYIIKNDQYVRNSVIKKVSELLDSESNLWSKIFEYSGHDNDIVKNFPELKSKLIEVMYKDIITSLNQLKFLDRNRPYDEAEYFALRNFVAKFGDSERARKRVFVFIKENFNNLIDNLTPLIVKKLSANQIISSGIISIFSKDQLTEVLSKVKIDSNAIRKIDDYDAAINMFDRVENDTVQSLPNQISNVDNNIRISQSIYQQEQRPDEFSDITRYELSQNNTKPTKVLFDIGKKLIHAGDGVNHSTIGISGFTSLWCLVTFVVERDIDTLEPTDIKLVVEQYQSDYPVVLDRIFMGNVRDPDTGKVIEKDESAYQNLVDTYGEEDAKDAKRHFAIISQNYPYIALINAIKVAKTIGLPYIYVMQDAPQFANIANASKANKLYSLIPQQVSDGIESIKGYNCFRIRASDEAIVNLSRSLDMGAEYDYSLTPAQNASLRKKDESIVQQRQEWRADDLKIQKLNDIRNNIKALLPTSVDIPQFEQPKDALRFLNTEVNKKIVPSSVFKSRFSEVVSELGLLARAQVAYERMIKLSSIQSSISLTNMNDPRIGKYKLKINALLKALKNVY